MRVILEWDEDLGKMREQLHAARSAVQDLINERDIWGVRINGSYFGVKRNKESVRVYPQRDEE